MYAHFSLLACKIGWSSFWLHMLTRSLLSSRDMSHLLAGVIGFSGAVHCSFTRLLEMHTMAFTSLADITPQHVMSVVVEDTQGTLQLFSKGNVETVVQSCPQVCFPLICCLGQRYLKACRRFFARGQNAGRCFSLEEKKQ